MKIINLFLNCINFHTYYTKHKHFLCCGNLLSLLQHFTKSSFSLAEESFYFHISLEARFSPPSVFTVAFWGMVHFILGWSSIVHRHNSGIVSVDFSVPWGMVSSSMSEFITIVISLSNGWVRSLLPGWGGTTEAI